MPRVLVAGKLRESGLALIESADVCDYVPDPDPGAYLARLPEAEDLVLRTQPLAAGHVAEAPALRIVSRHGVGYDAVDVAALDARAIPLTIVGDVNSGAVAEHAMMLMLAASRRLAKSAAAVKGGEWAYRDRLESREIHGRPCSSSATAASDAASRNSRGPSACMSSPTIHTSRRTVSGGRTRARRGPAVAP